MFALFIECMSFLPADFLDELFFILKKSAVEIIHELGYFTSADKKSVKIKMKFLKVRK